MCVKLEYRNPYTPGAGYKPSFLAGREEVLDEANKYLSIAKHGGLCRSFIFYGLRGVGKTVLLNTIEETAEENDMITTHFETTERDTFIHQIVWAMNSALKKLSRIGAVKSLLENALECLKSFSLTYNIEDNSISGEIVKPSPSKYSSPIFIQEFIELFVSVGRAAKKANHSVCFFIDEIQYAKENEISAIIAAIHRCNQLGLPVVLFAAGLPKILRSVGESASYSERLFRFKPIGTLNAQAATSAIVNPAYNIGVSYSKNAINKILEITEGYPYFIQELCSIIIDKFQEVDQIDSSHVKIAEEDFIKELDTGFFKVRYDRCTRSEMRFMYAMANCQQLPCSISNVAIILNQKVKSISPIRAQLVNKGMIYATGHGEIDFTVPQFSGYLKRITKN